MINATIRFDSKEKAALFVARPQDLTIRSTVYAHVASYCVDVTFDGLTTIEEMEDRLIMDAVIVKNYEH